MIWGPGGYLGLESRGVENTFMLCCLKNKDSHVGPTSHPWVTLLSFVIIRPVSRAPNWVLSPTSTSPSVSMSNQPPNPVDLPQAGLLFCSRLSDGLGPDPLSRELLEMSYLGPSPGSPAQKPPWPRSGLPAVQTGLSQLHSAGPKWGSVTEVVQVNIVLGDKVKS